MGRYYRRDGTPYPGGEKGLLQWAMDFNNPDIHFVRQDLLPNGYWVSTVWLGLNHNWGDGPPLIFETMVLNPAGEWCRFQERYATENDAIAGHYEAADFFAHQLTGLRAAYKEN